MKLTLALAALAIGTATFSEASLSHSQPAAPASAARRHHAKLARDNTTESDFELTRRGGCSGFGTYYNVQTGNQGACGGYLSNDEFTVAIAQPGWNSAGNLNAPGQYCGRKITITANGKSAVATIQDACPTTSNCKSACDLDMSPSLFQHFGNLGIGILDISWTFGDGGAPSSSGNVVHNIVNSVTGGNKASSNDNSDEEAAASKAAAAASASKAAASASSASASRASASRVAASKSAAAHRSKVSAASVRSRKSVEHAKSVKSVKSRKSVEHKASVSKAAASAAASYAAAPKNLMRLNNIVGAMGDIAGNAQ